jgi:hypothetical protein
LGRRNNAEWRQAVEDLKEQGGDDVVRPSSTLQKIQAKKFLKKILSLQHRSVYGIGGEQSFRRGGGGGGRRGEEEGDPEGSSTDIPMHSVE